MHNSLVQRLHSRNTIMTELTQKASRDLANVTTRHPNGRWLTPRLPSWRATSPCPSRLPSKSPSKVQPGSKGIHSSKYNPLPTHTEISRILPPMSRASDLAEAGKRSRPWPPALPAAELLLVCLLKHLPAASYSPTLKSTDSPEDVKHLYNNDDSKPHHVQREVIFTG